VAHNHLSLEESEYKRLPHEKIWIYVLEDIQKSRNAAMSEAIDHPDTNLDWRSPHGLHLDVDQVCLVSSMPSQHYGSAIVDSGTSLIYIPGTLG
jgi:hypothetical protein